MFFAHNQKNACENGLEAACNPKGGGGFFPEDTTWVHLISQLKKGPLGYKVGPKSPVINGVTWGPYKLGYNPSYPFVFGHLYGL